MEDCRRVAWAKIDAEPEGPRKTVAMLDAVRWGRITPDEESFSECICDAMQFVSKYIAIGDIVRNPGGVDEPGSITIADILKKNTEVRLERDGWKLLTYRTPEEREALETKLLAEKEYADEEGSDSE